MKRLFALAPLLILSCEMAPPDTERREITVERFSNSRISRSVCEVRGRLRNSGNTELRRPIIGVEVERGGQIVAASETPLNIFPLPVGTSIPFDIPYRCSGVGAAVRFSGRDNGRIVTVIS